MDKCLIALTVSLVAILYTFVSNRSAIEFSLVQKMERIETDKKLAEALNKLSERLNHE